MKARTQLVAGLVIVCGLTGCVTTGLSPGERAGVSYPNYVLSLKTRESNSPPQKIGIPIRLAVAQVGESAPPKQLLDKLETRHDLVASVVGLPAPGEVQRSVHGLGLESEIGKSESQREDFATRVQSLCRLSRSIGADYVFLYGGDVSSWHDANALKVLDITIIGGMIFPSTRIETEGRAAGAFISATTSEPVLFVSVDARRSKSSPSFFAYEKTDAQRVSLRNQLTTDLGEEFLQKLAALGSSESAMRR